MAAQSLAEAIAAELRTGGQSVERSLDGLAAELFARRGLVVANPLTEFPIGAPGEVVLRLLDERRDDRDPTGAALLGNVYEQLVHAPERRARGAHFTPAEVAERLVGFALADVVTEPTFRACDPTCGGGAFLLATAQWLHERGWSRRDVLGAIYGADIDPLAVWVSRTALELWAGEHDPDMAARIVVGDSLHSDAAWTVAGLDAVIGNPPFQSQLRRATTRPHTPATSAGAPAAPYADSAALFLLRSLALVKPGGRVALIQPHSTLVARDAGPVRAAVMDNADLCGLWFARDAVFAAAVGVCAPVLQRRVLGASDAATSGGPTVARVCDRGFVSAARVAPPQSPESWAGLIRDLLGTPLVELSPHAHLGDVATATAGFRDEYYGLIGAVGEEADAASDGARLITCGLIDALRSRWGTTPATFARAKFAAPVVDVGRLEGRVATWVQAQLVPKVLVGTQGKVIEVIVDELGDAVPSTPVIAVHAPAERLWHIAAALSAPCISAFAYARVAGAARSVGAIKLAARQVLTLPLPIDEAAWDRGAALARAAQHADAKEHEVLMDALGRVMDDAYGCHDPEVFAWWAARRRRSSRQSGVRVAQ
jgi:N-6 DNA Methylase